MADDETPRVHRFLKSDLFRNLTSFVACIFAGVAVIISLYTLRANANAQKQQADFEKQQAERSGDDLHVADASLILWNETEQRWTTHNAYTDIGRSVSISSDEWKASRGQRSFTVDLTNDGHQAAHISQTYFITNYDADTHDYTYGDLDALAPQCADWGTAARWGPCPESVEPHQTIGMMVNIPDELLRHVSAKYRDLPLQLCVASGSTTSCAAGNAALPPEAFN